jgi:hypothetical protein
MSLWNKFEAQSSNCISELGTQVSILKQKVSPEIWLARSSAPHGDVNLRKVDYGFAELPHKGALDFEADRALVKVCTYDCKHTECVCTGFVNGRMSTRKQRTISACARVRIVYVSIVRTCTCCVSVRIMQYAPLAFL